MAIINIEYEIAYDLWSRNIYSISGLNSAAIKKLESMYEFSVEEVDSIILDNWDRWNDEMDEYFRNMKLENVEHQGVDFRKCT